ncbi:DUF6296 family protein [Kitasatospora terrestris]|uniref:Uncharacterized protein n=1 Tax=Kitasatospora terrestris TaxID=258051 RepID=A0ABP9DAJ9_9ACTN
MAITAVHTERGRLETSRDGLGCDWTWTAVHRARPRGVGLPGVRVHAKPSPTRLRFFTPDGHPVYADPATGLRVEIHGGAAKVLGTPEPRGRGAGPAWCSVTST